MSWLFSQVLVEEYLGDISSDGEQSVQSSGNPTQLAYCAPDKMTVFSRLSRFGMTYKPLTEDRGEELLMSYLEAFPVQDISIAGRGAGLDGESSSMWYHMARVVSEVRPRSVFVENSPMLIHRGIGRVLGDLSSLGYDSKWTVMGAADVGAPHQRDRVWIVAHSRYGGGGDKRIAQTRQELSRERSTHPDQIGGSSEQPETLAHTSKEDVQRQRKPSGVRAQRDTPCGSGWWAIEPALDRVANGVACRVDRLKAIGNGQVPEVARRAWEVLNAD
jgi:DNA (cytosine-5)-methyltransferase 1